MTPAMIGRHGSRPVQPGCGRFAPWALLLLALLPGQVAAQDLPPLPPLPPIDPLEPAPPPSEPPPVAPAPADIPPATTETPPLTPVVDAPAGTLVPPGTGQAALPSTMRDPDIRGDLPRGDGLRLHPRVVLRPYLRLAAVYDDNVFRTAADEQDDWLLEARTGVDLDLALRRNVRAGVGYSFGYRTYVDESDLNGIDHRGHANLGMELKRIDLRLAGHWSRLDRPFNPRVTEGLGLDAAGQLRRQNLDGLASVRVRLTDHFAVRGEGQLYTEEYRTLDGPEGVEAFDNRGWAGRGILDWMVNRRISLLLGAEMREIIYTNEAAIAPDLRIYGGFGGVEARLRRLELQLRLGYAVSEVTKTRLDPDPSEPSGFTAALRAVWKPLRFTEVLAELSRRIDVSTTAQSEVDTRFGVEVRQGITREVALFLRAAYEHHDRTRGPTLHVFRVSGGPSWRPLPWLTLGVEAGWTGWRSSGQDVDGTTVAVWVMFAP